LPWETIGQYIRSGHRSPEEFQPNSLRTITLSEDEGIKAIIGKPKGKDAMEIQSYLFDVGKGWTLDKAKAWFEEQHKSEVAREHVLAILPLKVLEKIVDKPLRIRGIAMTAGLSRNLNIYTPEELQAFVNKLVSAPVYIEHVSVPNAVGKVAKTEWDGQNLWYEAEIYDEETAEKIRRGLVRHVSVGADYKAIDILDGNLPHGLHNAELSLVAVPGIPETSIQIMEKLRGKEQAIEPIISGEYILGFYQDASAFLPEHFRNVWLDKQNGVLAVIGRLREQPEAERVQAIFFAKEKMWDQTRIRDWLSLHPDYMAPAGVSASAAPLKEREKMAENNENEKLRRLTERVWTRRYISDLPDDAFAVILPGGKKDEGGKTVPRTLRKFPHHDSNGRLDPAHVRNANARIPQSDMTVEQKEQAMRHMARHKKQTGIGMAAEEARLVEQEPEEVEFEVSPEPTTDELIASIEDVVEQISDALEALTARVEKLEQALKPQVEQGKGEGIAESLLKKSEDPVITVKEAIQILESLLPSPMVERSSLGEQRHCQDIRRAIFQLRERLSKLESKSHSVTGSKRERPR